MGTCEICHRGETAPKAMVCGKCIDRTNRQLDKAARKSRKYIEKMARLAERYRGR